MKRATACKVTMPHAPVSLVIFPAALLTQRLQTEHEQRIQQKTFQDVALYSQTCPTMPMK